MTTFAYLGTGLSSPTKKLDTFPAPPVSWVRFSSEELTSHCPVTHQPDFYRVFIEYRPAAVCVESKSLKLYLQTFRDSAQFAESLAAEIARDIDAAIAPHRVTVTLTQQIRGGLQLEVMAEVAHERNSDS
jgi:7-cyano-7-deazaguanine reductase